MQSLRVRIDYNQVHNPCQLTSHASRAFSAATASVEKLNTFSTTNPGTFAVPVPNVGVEVLVRPLKSSTGKVVVVVLCRRCCCFHTDLPTLVA